MESVQLNDWWDKHIKHYWTLKDDMPRDSQKEMIHDIITAFNNGYENVILEGGTGTGKSAIATTIARLFNESYILTTTNQLLKQYNDDFKEYISEIKGKTNYTCRYTGKPCTECYIEHINKINDIKAKREILSNDPNWTFYENVSQAKYDEILSNLPIWKCNDCTYTEALKNAQSSNHVSSNYDFMYYAGCLGDLFESKELVVFDECHNFESKVLNLSKFEMNKDYILEEFGVDIFSPVLNSNNPSDLITVDYWVEILQTILLKIQDAKLEMKSKLIYEVGLPEGMVDNFLKGFDNKMAHYLYLSRLLTNKSWNIFAPTLDEIIDETNLKVRFIPKTASEHSHFFLSLGRYRLFMTGTLCDKTQFCKWNGLDESKTKHIYFKSPYPAINRPIVKTYVKNMSGSYSAIIDGTKTTLPNWNDPKIIDKLKVILDLHSNEKIVIHTTSNSQSEWLLNNLLDYDCIIASGDNRMHSIKLFEESDEPLILISPSIKEGVDLKGDKCRCQILFKAPKPFLGDDVIKTRLETSGWDWFNHETIYPLMQAYGRGIRDENDYCVMYLLDTSCEKLFDNYEDYFNEYWWEGIESGKQILV